jgi:hypothetical protein
MMFSSSEIGNRLQGEGKWIARAVVLFHRSGKYLSYNVKNRITTPWALRRQHLMIPVRASREGK